MRRTHFWLTMLWALAFVPSVLWWKDSVPFLVWVSVYANFVGHLSSYQAVRGEEAGLTDAEMRELLVAARATNTPAPPRPPRKPKKASK